MSKEKEEIDAIEKRDIANLATHKKDISGRNVIELTPEQTEFVETSQRNYATVLFSGGRGAGKSLALCVKIYEYLCVPNTTVVFVRQFVTDLKRSTLRMLLYGRINKDGSFAPPILPPHSIKSYNRVENTIEMINGSVLILAGCTDVEKIKSIACAVMVVEELSQLTEETFIQLLFIPREYHPLGVNRCFCASNPPKKTHWIYRFFVTDKDANRKIIYVNSDSNPNLGESYKEMLHRLPAELQKTMLRGEFGDTSDGVFYQFDASKNVLACKDLLGDCTEVVIGLDPGGGREFLGACIAGKLPDGRIIVTEEWNKKAPTHREILQWCSDRRKTCNGRVVIDSANTLCKNELEANSFTCFNSIKDIPASVQLMNDLFAEGNLIIDPSVYVGIQEIAEAENGENGRWHKRVADVIDAIRYAVVHLCDLGREHQPNKDYWYIF